jgi:RNA polymerase sigma-70 factor (ECF subfamily)
MAVMDSALAALEREFNAAGKADQFHGLKTWLIGEGSGLSQAESARQLGLTEGAVKVAIHRLRKRFGDTVRAEISHTLRDPAPERVEEELQHLFAALA